MPPLTDAELEAPWSDVPPTVPGWYWWRFKDEKPTIRNLLACDVDLNWPEALGGKWLGPITPDLFAELSRLTPQDTTKKE